MNHDWSGERDGGYPDYWPGENRLKTAGVQAAIWLLGRAMACASRYDPVIQKELSNWPPGYTVMLKVRPDGPFGGWVKTESGSLSDQGCEGDPRKSDLVIYFKNLESAFMVLFGRIGTPWAFAQHRMSIQGDLGQSMRFTRCLNRVQTFLYPRFLAGRLMKSPPDIPLGKRLYLRSLIYLLGIPLGF